MTCVRLSGELSMIEAKAARASAADCGSSPVFTLHVAVIGAVAIRVQMKLVGVVVAAPPTTEVFGVSSTSEIHSASGKPVNGELPDHSATVLGNPSTKG